MSFGFSVGDIILVGRLTYKLYSTITSGRRSAAKDLKELADVLFGLHCALDHLRKAAKDISATASKQQDADAVGMHEKLDAMIGSCGTTVQELESMMEKYRKATGPTESDVADAKKGPADRFKQSVQANWVRIRWDMDRNSLSEYRTKLQAHMDAINIVLTTFVWSAVNRIDAEKTQEIKTQALQSNSSLVCLVQEIHAALLGSKCVPSQSPATPSVLSPPSQRRLSGERIYSIYPHYSPDSLVAATQPQNSTASIPAAVALAMTVEPPLNGKITNNPPLPIRRREKQTQRESEFPAAITLLNERRRLISSKEFAEYRKKYHPLKPPSEPSFLAPEIPTVSQLHDGLIYAFRHFYSTAAANATFHDEHQRKVIFHWTQGLERLVDSWVSESAVPSANLKEAKQAEWNEVIDLLIGLNGLIEESDDRMKRVFYHSTEQGGIDVLLHKWQALSNSVRGAKELEEFNDVREEWKYSQSNG